MTFARIHQYLSMAMPLIFTRQQDTFGALGLALNACNERNGHLEELDADPRAARRGAGALAHAARGAGRRPSAALVARTTVAAHPSRGHRRGDDRCLSSRSPSTATRYAVEAPVGTSLAQLLREELGLTGTKIACNEGHCGACTVQIDGMPTLSCITLAHTVDGARSRRSKACASIR